MAKLPRSVAVGVSMLLACAHGAAYAGDFLSIARTQRCSTTHLQRGRKKLYVMGRGYPVEVIVLSSAGSRSETQAAS